MSRACSFGNGEKIKKGITRISAKEIFVERVKFFDERKGAFYGNGVCEDKRWRYIHYQVEGGGKTILLVHGWGVSSKFYVNNVDVLKKDFRIVTIDLRGHGLSSKGLHGYTLGRLAMDIHEVIEALALENVMLMGW